MKRVVAAFVAGALFGLGLALSRMSDPNVVLGFLDVFGQFDPTMLIAFPAALGTAWIGYRIVLRRSRPVLAAAFPAPASQAIDRGLVAGAVIFGVGWGLAGYCPGAVLVGLGGAVGTAAVFFVAMIAGSAVQRQLAARAAVVGASRQAA
jgi:uncharacterized membrane protein YedE/YeeE